MVDILMGVKRPCVAAEVGLLAARGVEVDVLFCGSDDKVLAGW